ncbi:L,D-transpeptidase family protein [Frankia sp. R82]|uniref:L,D-transpeptidase family protein n=1 Tax=Frankia sp. R82 TaxID=2950553 RepID=UPI002043E3CB|nr:L,D-transpeptidase family protein [Frankia sp. R82]MCM3885404.1 hypothetical protein [Frankia sp. R82]
MAAIGTTLVVGAAGALHLDDSADGSTGPSSGSARVVRPNWAAGPNAAGSGTGGASVAGRAGAIPGIGSVMMARVPREALQAIVVSGVDRDANTNSVTLWQRADVNAPWMSFGTPMTGRNGAEGWTEAHREGDLRSPIGVFSLTAAGGRLPNPGSAMPYEYRPSFYQTAAPQGEPLADAFNYVVAIDYNRLPGRAPSDPNRPLGGQVGGDIWLHVDHRSPTRGCVALPQSTLVSVMRWLSPGARPMILMGDVADLSADV